MISSSIPMMHRKKCARKPYSITILFPILFDASQQTAKAYQAACTPDFYIFDGDLKCTYRGRFDESSPGNGKPITGNDMRRALDAMLQGQQPSTVQLTQSGVQTSSGGNNRKFFASFVISVILLRLMRG